MPRTTRNSKTSSSAAMAPKKKPPNRKKKKEENKPLIKMDTNICNNHSSPLSSPEHEKKPTAAPKKRNGRPPLPSRKGTKKDTKNAEKNESKFNNEVSPLQQMKLSSRTTASVAAIASSPGRPFRRAAAAKKKQYAEVDSATDEETSSSDESDYGVNKSNNSKGQPIARKANKRKKGAPATRKTPKTKKSKAMKTPSPQAKRISGKTSLASPAKKKNTNGSPSVFATPQGATTGLTPIQDSVSKVWKSDGGDWRVQGAIDYGFD